MRGENDLNAALRERAEHVNDLEEPQRVKASLRLLDEKSGGHRIALRERQERNVEE